MNSFQAEREEIVLAGRRLAGRRLVAGNDGNISVRADHNSILITPSGRSLGSLAPSDMPLLNSQGEPIVGELKPSTEAAMHLAIYRGRPDVGAVVHAHPPYATAFATAGVELPWEAVPELIVFVGPVALCSYATPGTEAVPQSLEPYWADHNAFLLRNHGLLTVGESLNEAQYRLEIVEHAAKILHLSHQLGGAAKLPPDELDRLASYRQALRENPR